ncbi:Rieske domain-containing protein [Esox lucius]|uniref:Rieske domain-containing protein n=1 Tax=Esox lucius TaxID=8010 RepID=A0AAY5L8Y6_ESOLU|nr:Rieske domain-containing protein [Esox lucius]XP_010879144.1 Rieske domain-containing protein [Esox lucius]
MEESAERLKPTAGPHLVGRKEDLIKAKRSFRTLEGRDVLVIHHQGTFYAMDFHCYHAGGPLQNGDIEEFDGKLCIVCPKHKYKISLADGEGIYSAKKPQAPEAAPTWHSKGIKQRIHTVTEINGDVYVTLSCVPRFIDSDYFQGEKGRIERERFEAEDAKKNSKARTS